MVFSRSRIAARGPHGRMGVTQEPVGGACDPSPRRLRGEAGEIATRRGAETRGNRGTHVSQATGTDCRGGSNAQYPQASSAIITMPAAG